MWLSQRGDSQNGTVYFKPIFGHDRKQIEGHHAHHYRVKQKHEPADRRIKRQRNREQCGDCDQSQRTLAGKDVSDLADYKKRNRHQQQQDHWLSDQYV